MSVYMGTQPFVPQFTPQPWWILQILTFTISHYFAFIHICCKQFLNCLKFNLVCLCVLFSFNNMLYRECSLGFWEQAYDGPRKLPTDEDQTGCWEQKSHIPVVLYSCFLLTCTNICNLSCSTSVLHILVWHLFFSFFLIWGVNCSIFVSCVTGCMLQDKLKFLKETCTDCLPSFCEFFLCAYDNHS